jgi:hypothetical protein
MKTADKQLEHEKKIYKKLTTLFENLKNTQNGSEMLINDSKEQYNKAYAETWQMVFGIIFVSLFLVKVFKQNRV